MEIPDKALLKSLFLALSLFFQCTLFSQNSLVDGIVACYPLDGDAKDISGNCLHGSIYGATSTEDRNRVPIHCMYFDGKDDYIEVPHSPLLNFDLDSDFAISLWLKLSTQIDVDTTDNDIISKWIQDDDSEIDLANGYPYALRIINKKDKNSGKIYWAQFGGFQKECRGAVDPHSKNSISKSEFINVVLNVKNNRFYMYINGRLESRQANNVYCSPMNKAPLRIGRRGGKMHNNYFNGYVDDLCFWNRALSESEITSLADKSFSIRNLIDKSTDKINLVDELELLFEEDTWSISEAHKQALAPFSSRLKRGSEDYVVIEGHTNKKCEESFCLKLSFQRAKIIEQYFFDQGLGCSNIVCRGLGKSQANSAIEEENQKAVVKLYQKRKK